MAHHHSGTTSTFNEMATEGEASAATPSKVHSPPLSRPMKVQPAAPKSNVSSIQAAISALGVNPDLAVLASLQEALQRAKESSSSTHVQAEPGKSPHARVAEAQARVSRLQAALDLGADNPDAELLKSSLEIAKWHCRVQPVGERLDSCLKFVERAQGRIERQKKIVEEAQQLLTEVCPPERSGRRRLVIFGAQTQEPVDPIVFDEDLEVGSHHSSDTESIDSWGGTFDAAGEAEVVSVPEAPVPAVSVPVERFTDSFQWLGEVDLEVVFKQRPCLMKSVPGFMKGAYQSAMRIAFAKIDQGRVEGDATRSSRGWKLFLLLPRLLLHKPPRGGLVPKRKLQDRFEVFADGDWASLHKIWREQTSPKTSSCCSAWGVSAGGVRGIVCGDIVRRLVARSVAQQIAPAVQEATSPFQYVLTTKVGGECVAHAIPH